jgi:hypothetical protein
LQVNEVEVEVEVIHHTIPMFAQIILVMMHAQGQ